MPEFRWSIDGGVTWTYEDQPLPHVLPVGSSDNPIVQAIGTGAQAGDYIANQPDQGPIAVLIAGQSNSVGRAVYDGLGYHASNSWQWVQAAGEIQPVDGLAMLDHPDPNTSGDMGLSIGLSDALRAMYPGRQIIFVPCGHGTTDFNSGDWTAGTGPRYQDMVARANAFTAATGHSISFVAWHQGEFDTSHWRPYHSALTAMMDQAAQDITGLSPSTPWVLGEVERTIGGARKINAQLQDLPHQRAYTALVASEGLSRFDTYHFDAASLRTLGARYCAAWSWAKANVSPAGFADLLLGEWYLGDENHALTTQGGGDALVPVAAAPALANGYATLSGGNGLESPFAETENLTILAVVRRHGNQNTMYMGNLPDPGSTGVGGFYFNNSDGFNTRGQPFGLLTPNETQAGQWHLVAMNAGATPTAAALNPRNISLATVIGADQASSDIKSVENGSSRTPYLGHNLGVGDVAYGMPGSLDVAYFAIYSGQLGLGELAVQYDRIRNQLAARGIDLA